MIFETLYESAKKGELLLIDGGFCHWHLRRDGQLTIREIIATRKGAGKEMLSALMQTPGAICLVARCPSDLAANEWYVKQGFELNLILSSGRGRVINEWKLPLSRH